MKTSLALSSCARNLKREVYYHSPPYPFWSFKGHCLTWLYSGETWWQFSPPQLFPLLASSSSSIHFLPLSLYISYFVCLSTYPPSTVIWSLFPYEHLCPFLQYCVFSAVCSQVDVSHSESHTYFSFQYSCHCFCLCACLCIVYCRNLKKYWKILKSIERWGHGGLREGQAKSGNEIKARTDLKRTSNHGRSEQEWWMMACHP